MVLWVWDYMFPALIIFTGRMGWIWKLLWHSVQAFPAQRHHQLLQTYRVKKLLKGIFWIDLNNSFEILECKPNGRTVEFIICRCLNVVWIHDVVVYMKGALTWNCDIEPCSYACMRIFLFIAHKNWKNTPRFVIFLILFFGIMIKWISNQIFVCLILSRAQRSLVQTCYSATYFHSVHNIVWILLDR